MLTRRGVPRYRPRIDDRLTVHLLTYDGDQEVEIPVTVYVDDWDENSISSVMLHGWDIEGLLTEDESDQIYTAMAEHKATMADYYEAAEEDYGDYVMEVNRERISN